MMLRQIGRNGLACQARCINIMSLKNLQRKKKEKEESTDEDKDVGFRMSDSKDPWMYAMLDEERLGAMRGHELSLAHKLEFQRLYIPDLKLPSQDDIVKLGAAPSGKPHPENYTTPLPDKYTVESRKMYGKELYWGKDSIRQQLDGTFDPKTREDLTAKLRTDVPVPDLDWNVQFPMWNPRKHKPPTPSKGRLMYMYSLAKGQAYIFQKQQKNVYSRNLSYRGLA
eukprot:TRINITY_DN9365_c0_g1_i1.p1 TRINITY_DN9365_c0_g1~~TRINITY_DN9365_c0_g1_i1.p1  ORF type:complete len:248 (+),score=58.66 TRINITY_DN9365_c0_g1_i1:72-746(+)